METIKVIDILNKIANGEEVPKKIKTPSGIVLTYDEDIKNYFGETTELFSSYVAQDLDIEVEIIEEDKKIYKIEKIKPAQEYCYNDNEHYTQKEINEKIRKRFYNHECYMSDLANSINEIIDYINKENK